MPFHRLEVFQKAYRLALEVHRLSLGFPPVEQFGLAKQVRDSSKSIPVCIGEGMGKQESPKDVVRFLRMALGSCDETRIWLDFSKDLGYISVAVHRDLDRRYREVGRMLTGLRKRWSSGSDPAGRPSSSF